MSGIKETKEALIAINAIAIFIISRMKDGVGLDDAMAIWDKMSGENELKDKVITAFENWQQIPGELDDLDLDEAIELGKLQMDFIPSILVALKKS